MDDGQQWPYWTYLVNFEIAANNDFQHGVLDVAWSLAIEEQFYIVWAVVVWLMSPRSVGWLCAVVVLAAPIARALALDAGADPVDVYVLPHYRADALATGALLAWLSRRGSLAPLTTFAPWIAGGFAAAAGAAVDEPPWWGPGRSASATRSSRLRAELDRRRPHAPTSSVWPRLLSAGWLRAFGKYSYCLYLIHLPVMRVMHELVLPQISSLLSLPCGRLNSALLSSPRCPRSRSRGCRGICTRRRF